MNELSRGQLQYLNAYRRGLRIIRISRILIFLSFLFIWEFTANVGIMDSFIFSSPSRIALCFWEMVLDESIFLHMGVTLYETILSFLLVIAASILIAVCLWFSPRLSKILDPYLVVLNSLPKSALAPLLIVWLGASRTTIIVAGMSVAIFGSILNLYASFATVDPGKIKPVSYTHLDVYKRQGRRLGRERRIGQGLLHRLRQVPADSEHVGQLHGHLGTEDLVGPDLELVAEILLHLRA